MVFRLVMVLGFVLLSVAGYSQEAEQKKTKRPDIPGSFMVELGLNVKSGTTPPTFVKGLWGSRTVNFYYQYPFRLFKSNFSFVPGIGLSLERWKFTNNATLPAKPLPDGTYPLVSAYTLFPGTINRSQLINNYVEMPLEFRYDTNPEDIARSLSVSIGGRFGVLYDSFTKVDYRDNAENKSTKDKQFHGMNPFRYGIVGRLGVGGFSLFGYFNLSPMFEDGKGPQMTTMSSSTFGISINGF